MEAGTGPVGERGDALHRVRDEAFADVREVGARGLAGQPQLLGGREVPGPVVAHLVLDQDQAIALLDGALAARTGQGRVEVDRQRGDAERPAGPDAPGDGVLADGRGPVVAAGAVGDLAPVRVEDGAGLARLLGLRGRRGAGGGRGGRRGRRVRRTAAEQVLPGAEHEGDDRDGGRALHGDHGEDRPGGQAAVAALLVGRRLQGVVGEGRRAVGALGGGAEEAVGDAGGLLGGRAGRVGLGPR